MACVADLLLASTSSDLCRPEDETEPSALRLLVADYQHDLMVSAIVHISFVNSPAEQPSTPSAVYLMSIIAVIFRMIPSRSRSPCELSWHSIAFSPAWPSMAESCPAYSLTRRILCKFRRCARCRQ